MIYYCFSLRPIPSSLAARWDGIGSNSLHGNILTEINHLHLSKFHQPMLGHFNTDARHFGSRERRVWASQSVCFITFPSWDVSMARGFSSQSCSRARRGSLFQCNSSNSIANRFSDRSRLLSKKVSKKVSKRIRNWKTRSWKTQVC